MRAVAKSRERGFERRQAYPPEMQMARMRTTPSSTTFRYMKQAELTCIPVARICCVPPPQRSRS